MAKQYFETCKTISFEEMCKICDGSISTAITKYGKKTFVQKAKEEIENYFNSYISYIYEVIDNQKDYGDFEFNYCIGDCFDPEDDNGNYEYILSERFDWDWDEVKSFLEKKSNIRNLPIYSYIVRDVVNDIVLNNMFNVRSIDLIEGDWYRPACISIHYNNQ